MSGFVLFFFSFLNHVWSYTFANDRKSGHTTGCATTVWLAIMTEHSRPDRPFLAGALLIWPQAKEAKSQRTCQLKSLNPQRKCPLSKLFCSLRGVALHGLLTCLRHFGEAYGLTCD